MSVGRAILMVLVSAAFLLLIGWGSRIRLGESDVEQGLLRLSWRVRPERIESCRDRTQAELDALPVHMRTPRVCEARSTPYRLIVEIDDGRPDTTIMVGAGARQDRPIYVLRDSLLATGEHEVEVVFEREDSLRTTALRFEEDVRFSAGQIVLITLSEDGKSLVSRTRVP
ncbi:MAG TPA: hypothetical protein VFZ04_18285 [Longimicrobiales bacterium]